MKRWVRRSFYACAALFWAGTAAVGLELFAVWRHNANEKLAARAESAHYTGESANADNAVIAKYASTPPITGKDFDARRAFFGLDAPGRAAYAADRGEVVALCDGEGKIQDLWTPPDGHVAAEVAAFGKGLKPGAVFFDLLPPDLSGDARTAFAEAKGGASPLRDYPVPQAGNAPYVMQFAMERGPDGRAVGLFIRSSVWKQLWQAFRPGMHQNDRMDLRINARGFPGDEVALPKPARVCRIVCVGGSTTAEGATAELTYPGILRRKFADALGPGRVDVVNAGIFGLLSADEAGHIPDYLALEPDLVIHYNFVNETLHLARNWFEGPAAAARIRAALMRSRFVYDCLGAWLLPRDAVIDGVIRETVMVNLAKLADACQDRGVELAVCTFAAPEYPALDRAQRAFFDRCMFSWGRGQINMTAYLRLVGRYNALVTAFCARRGLRAIPVAEAAWDGTDCFTDICHMRPNGIEKKAEIVFQALREPVTKRLAGKI